MRITLFLSLSSALLCAENFSYQLSSQGFTGLINTPNAQIISESTAVFSYNNQFDNNIRNYNSTIDEVSQEDFLLGIGFSSLFEVVGRFTEVGALTTEREKNVGFEIRDLSANIKFKLPFKHKYLPNIAIGLQDLGSESSYYANNYIVADKEFGGLLRTSLGYGKSGTNKAGVRMNGIFGGLEGKVNNYIYLLAEHDGKENHAAVRLSLPSEWTKGLTFNATVAQNLTQPQTSFALNLSIPLQHNSRSPILEKEYKVEQKERLSSVVESKKEIKEEGVSSSISKVVKKDILFKIQNRLIEIGFENVQVGQYQNSIYIKCENSIFDHTDLDALGVIIGTVMLNSLKNKHYIITLLKNNIQTFTISGNSDEFKAYIENPTVATKLSFRNHLHFSRTFNEKKVVFISEKKNSSFFKPRLELSPGITTTIGTEVGMFDYVAALNANVYTNLYDGLTVSALYTIPFANSENFNEGRIFSYMYPHIREQRLLNAQIHQTLHMDSLFNTTSLGYFRGDSYGILNQTHMTTMSGEHGINLRVGSFENSESVMGKSKRHNIYMGTYRHYYAPLDLFTEVGYGQYWDEDKGAIFQLKRFFGETEVALYTQAGSSSSFVGFRVSIPLSWRKSSNFKWGQIKGKKDFSYGIRTIVKSPENTITPSGAILPRTDLELKTHYLDRDRLHGDYVKEHVDRIRDAFMTYEDL